MKRFRIGLPLALALVASGCAVDFILFNGVEVEGYGFDAYAGDVLDGEALDALGLIDPVAIREIRLSSGDETLAAVLVTDSDVTPDDTLLVYFHGSAQHLDYYWARVRLLHATGYPTLAVDYRGYGMSTGLTTAPSLLDDAAATMAYVANELGNPRVVIVGNSIGTLAAARMAADNDVAGLILEVPLNSLETMVADQFGASIPSEAIFEENISVRDDTAASDAPLLVFAAERDALFPPARHAEPIFNLHQARTAHAGRLVLVPGDHDGVPRGLGYDAFVSTVGDFVAGL